VKETVNLREDLTAGSTLFHLASAYFFLVLNNSYLRLKICIFLFYRRLPQKVVIFYQIASKGIFKGSRFQGNSLPQTLP